MTPEIFVVVGGAMTAMLLTVTLREIKREYAVTLSLTCTIALMLWAVVTMMPVIERLKSLIEATELASAYGEILLKSLGVAICTQLACDACKDAGEVAIGAKVEFCGKVCLVSLSLPLFAEILMLAQRIFSV